MHASFLNSSQPASERQSLRGSSVDNAKPWLRRLEVLSRDYDSGTLFLVTLDNKQIRIGLREGRIVSLVSGRFRGEAVLPLLATVDPRRMSWSEASADPEQALPDTLTLLATMASDVRPVLREITPSVPSPARSAERQAPASSPATVSVVSQKAHVIDWDAVLLELSDAMLRIAPELLGESGGQRRLMLLVNGLASGLENPAHAMRLKRQVTERLGSINA